LLEQKFIRALRIGSVGKGCKVDSNVFARHSSRITQENVTLK